MRLDVLHASDKEVLNVGFGVLENHEDETDGEKGDEGGYQPRYVALAHAQPSSRAGKRVGQWVRKTGAQVEEIVPTCSRKRGVKTAASLTCSYCPRVIACMKPSQVRG